METDKQKMPFVAPIRPFNLICVLVLAGGWAVNLIWGTPHLRVSWEASGRADNLYYRLCRYWGLTTFQIRPVDGRCPVIILSRKREG